MKRLIRTLWRGICPRRPWREELADWTERAIGVFSSSDFAGFGPALSPAAIRAGLNWCLDQAISGNRPLIDPDGLVGELKRIVRRSDLDCSNLMDQATLQTALNVAIGRSRLAELPDDARGVD